MASKFKTPKTFAGPAANSPAPKSNYDAEFGFSDNDSAGSRSGSESESENESGSDGEAGGVSFIEFLTLQKSLRKVTEQKLELTEQLKVSRDSLRKTQRQLDRATDMSKTQIAILQAAQTQQIGDKDKLNESVHMSLKELEEQKGAETGVNSLFTQVNELSGEKREYFEKWQTNEALYKQTKLDLEELEKDFKEKVAELNAEKIALQKQIDPVAMAKFAGAPADLDNPLINELRQENEKLRAQVRDAEFAATHGSASSSAASGASAEELRDLNNKLRAKTEENKELSAKLAKLQALSTADAQDGQAQAGILESEITDLKRQRQELETLADELKEKLAAESGAHSRVKSELTELKASMESAGAAASDAEKAKQELASVRASLKGETSAHEQTKKDLEGAKAELTTLKQNSTKSQASFDEQLKKEKERAAQALQKAKADFAAELAEAKQRAKDNMKDLTEKLGDMSKKLKPMAEAFKFISTNYRKVQKEMYDLRGEIAPSVKQCKRDLLRTLAEVDKNYKEMLRKYRKEMALRKKLHNELVDLKGNIRVFARVRPIIKEDGSGPDSKVVCSFDNDDDQLLRCLSKAKNHQFEFDHVFNMDSSQQDVYDQCKDLIMSVVDGFNVCIFAYGQTGSGKTFSMDGTDAHPGLNRRALAGLFELVGERKVDWSYEIEVSVLEIYNENLRDLLSDNPKSKLDIKHGKSGPFVPGLTTQPVSNADEVREKFDQAKTIRATSSTNMNDLSSRSHCLLIVEVIGTNLSTGVQTRGKLNLIDLAGSERVAKSGAIDDEKRLKEAMAINKSLSSLGDVIQALGSKQKHVPFRNSKLTHLLQDSLAGQAKCLMMVQISPVEKNVQETMCSLNFAQRVKAVELGAAKKTTDSAQVAQLKKRIKELEAAA